MFRSLSLLSDGDDEHLSGALAQIQMQPKLVSTNVTSCLAPILKLAFPNIS